MILVSTLLFLFLLLHKINSADEIRLVNGINSWEGRVEIYLNGQWGTVCDDSWDINDAEVVCRQLGLYTKSANSFTDAHFGEGSSRILLDEVECSGDESLLTDCSSNPVGDHDCDHDEDAGVSCENVTSGDIRLVNGAHSWEGRVEIYMNRQWGTVCDDSWDTKDAEVVCRHLGLNTGSAQRFVNAHFGQGSSSILLDEVWCSGHESLLTDCLSRPVGDHDCGHEQDAGVSCENVTDGDIRLVNGANSWEGRVEIYLNGQWGTVCDDSWDTNDADVVCRHLGLNTSSPRRFWSAHFGQGSSSILLDEVQCSGNESLLTECPSNLIGDHDCGHYEDAGVSCEPIPTTTTPTTTTTATTTQDGTTSTIASSGPWYDNPIYIGAGIAGVSVVALTLMAAVFKLLAAGKATATATLPALTHVQAAPASTALPTHQPGLSDPDGARVTAWYR